MTTSEFDDAAGLTAERLVGRPIDERIAAACRGSGNPAVLAWLAEGCGLGPGTHVVDLGSGLAGPAAWLVRHYRCSVVALDPSPGGVRGAKQLFALPLVQADATSAPLCADAFDVALAFGVVSVVAEPERILAEAARLARRVAVIDYCATGRRTVAAAGSRFPTQEHLLTMVAGAGYEPCGCIATTVPAPDRWSVLQRRYDAGDADPDVRQAVQAIDDLIEAGELSPRAVVAHRT